MFGFIRPVKAELKVKEADRFQQVYCGLCREIRAEYGLLYTFFLSYDMTFYALVYGCNEEAVHVPVKKRCMANPAFGVWCAKRDEPVSLSAHLSILLLYHKLKDTEKDEKGPKRLFAKLLRFIFRKGYNKAKSFLPEADKEMALALSDLQLLEEQNCDSMDRAADASARLTMAMIPDYGDGRSRVLRHMFYQLGRWLYLLDAAQDVAEDMEKNCYNPVVTRYKLESPDISAVRKPLELTLERSLVDVCMAFDLLDIRRDEGLIRNIIFLGMPVVTKQVLDGTYQTNGGWGKHGSL